MPGAPSENWTIRLTFLPGICQISDINDVVITVQASIQANTFVVSGQGETKELTELVPGILNQLGPDSLSSLRRLAENYQSQQMGGLGKEGGEDDDDVPDLVESFEKADDDKPE